MKKVRKVRKVSRKSKNKYRKRRRSYRKFGSIENDQKFIQEFESRYPTTIGKTLFFSKDIAIKFGLFKSDTSEDSKYYEPIYEASLMNMIIHPETLDYVMKTYYPETPRPKSPVSAIYSVPEYNENNIKKFNDNTSILGNFEISIISSILNIVKPKVPEDKLPLLHAALINHFMHPDTLRYIMLTRFKDQPTPSIFRHELYKQSGKIFLAILLISAIFAFIYRKKIVRETNPLINYAQAQISPLIKRRSPKRRSR